MSIEIVKLKITKKIENMFIDVIPLGLGWKEALGG
jgi:hypothetical protein